MKWLSPSQKNGPTAWARQALLLTVRVRGWQTPREGLGQKSRYLPSSTEVFQLLDRWLRGLGAHHVIKH